MQWIVLRYWNAVIDQRVLNRAGATSWHINSRALIRDMIRTNQLISCVS